MIMNIETVREDLKRDEGFRSFPYKCTAGKLTIGYGRNLEDKGISLKEAEYLLYDDILECTQDLQEIFPEFEDYSENVQRVLTNMRFQLGHAGLLAFKKTIKYIREKNWNMAAEEMMDSRWYRQTTKRAKRLIKLMREA